jgi:hypothetical protein
VIRALAQKDGKQAILLGLDDADLGGIIRQEPVKVNLRTLADGQDSELLVDLPDVDIWIFYANDEIEGAINSAYQKGVIDGMEEALNKDHER